MSANVEAVVAQFPLEKVVKQTPKALKALQTRKNDQTEEDKYVYLILALKKIASRASPKPIRIQIPNPFRSASSSEYSVCLITKDPLEVEKAKLPELPCIRYVESVKGLANKHKPFEAKRLLCASHDLFLADERVLPVLPKILGKVFFDKKKVPVPVDLQGKNLKQELESAISATYLHLNTGPCVSVRIGKVTQTTGELQENIEAVLSQINRRLPGGHENIKGLSLKTGKSISLPIFESAI